MIEELPNFRARAEYNRSKQDKKPTNRKKVNYGKGNHRPSWE